MVACVPASNPIGFPVEEVTVGGKQLGVWVADDAGERSQGLRELTRLPAEIDGMLFVFPEPAVPTFVMEDTLIPLDLWFFDESGLLVGHEEMQPCDADPCRRYPAPDDLLWALETPLGDFRFEPGDQLSTSDSG